MFANYLIGLREGLEATLIVSILVAYLVKAGRRDLLRPVAFGVAGAIALSLAFGAVITFTSRNMTFTEQELFGGFMSIVAVAFVTWMIMWMRTAARGLAGELRSKLEVAARVGGGAVVLIAFLAVAREGLETALFLWAAIQATGNGWAPITGAGLGLLTAVMLGYAIYRGAVRINLGTFFTWTGALLILVAAGVLAYGVHDLQEAGFLPGLNSLAFDVSEQIPPSSWYGTLLKGTLNFSPATTWLEAITWTLYVTVMMTLFFRPQRATTTVRSGVNA
ncbi:MAG: iron uptake transporter permease EfeU [Actinomycetales bacterium]